jgi:hypothetical protein
MPSASNTSNSSNLKIQSNFFQISTDLSSRLLVVLDADKTSGLTGGDAIFFNVTTSQYEKAVANSAKNSEIFGVVENVNSDNTKNVVIYGSIIYPTNLLINNTGANIGGNDVYFLSANTPGALENTQPTDIGFIIKPVYQTAPHGISFTGVIMNYIGYTITT